MAGIAGPDLLKLSEDLDNLGALLPIRQTRLRGQAENPLDSELFAELTACDERA